MASSRTGIMRGRQRHIVAASKFARKLRVEVTAKIRDGNVLFTWEAWTYDAGNLRAVDVRIRCGGRSARILRWTGCGLCRSGVLQFAVPSRANILRELIVDHVFFHERK